MHAASYDQAVEAAREWYAKHGRYPRPLDWERSVRGRPSTRTIRRRWGWEELLAAAGARSPGQVRRDRLRTRRRQLLLPLRRARAELGRWPPGHEWDRATADHPARRTYERHFGSWAAACRAAARLRVEEP